MKIYNNDGFSVDRNKEHIEIYRYVLDDDKTKVIFLGSYDNIEEAEKELEENNKKKILEKINLKYTDEINHRYIYINIKIII